MDPGSDDDGDEYTIDDGDQPAYLSLYTDPGTVNPSIYATTRSTEGTTPVYQSDFGNLSPTRDVLGVDPATYRNFAYSDFSSNNPFMGNDYPGLEQYGGGILPLSDISSVGDDGSSIHRLHGTDIEEAKLLQEISNIVSQELPLHATLSSNQLSEYSVPTGSIFSTATTSSSSSASLPIRHSRGIGGALPLDDVSTIGPIGNTSSVRFQPYPRPTLYTGDTEAPPLRALNPGEMAVIVSEARVVEKEAQPEPESWYAVFEYFPGEFVAVSYGIHVAEYEGKTYLGPSVMKANVLAIDAPRPRMMMDNETWGKRALMTFMNLQTNASYITREFYKALHNSYAIFVRKNRDNNRYTRKIIQLRCMDPNYVGFGIGYEHITELPSEFAIYFPGFCLFYTFRSDAVKFIEFNKYFEIKHVTKAANHEYIGRYVYYDHPQRQLMLQFHRAKLMNPEHHKSVEVLKGSQYAKWISHEQITQTERILYPIDGDLLNPSSIPYHRKNLFTRVDCSPEGRRIAWAANGRDLSNKMTVPPNLAEPAIETALMHHYRNMPEMIMRSFMSSVPNNGTVRAFDPYSDERRVIDRSFIQTECMINYFNIRITDPLLFDLLDGMIAGKSERRPELPEQYVSDVLTYTFVSPAGELVLKVDEFDFVCSSITYPWRTYFGPMTVVKQLGQVDLCINYCFLAQVVFQNRAV